MQTEAIFKHIAARLESELAQAQHSIYIAVAWFTRRELFDVLLDKAQQGIAVHLLVSNDAINQNGQLPFEELNQGQSSALLVGDHEYDLMHNKFCVIDENIVITGSYNWSYKAENSNHENVVIITDDKELAAQYIKQFNYIVRLQGGQELETTFSTVGVSVYLGRVSKIEDSYVYSNFGNDIGFLKPFGYDEGIEPLPKNASDKQRVYYVSLLTQHACYKFMLDVCNEMLANDIKQRVINVNDIDDERYPLVAKFYSEMGDKFVLVFNNSVVSNNNVEDVDNIDYFGFKD